MIGIRRRAVGVALVTVLLASLAAPPVVGAKLAGDKVRLGVIMPMAGLFVDWGQHGLIGAEFARDEINAADAVLYRKYEVYAISADGNTTSRIAVGLADLFFRKISSNRWVIIRWQDHVDPTVGANPSDTDQLSMGARRLEG